MPALSIMIKPSSGLCNMRCKYCFYHDVVSHREEGQLGFMSYDTVNNLIDKAISFANGDRISFVFQGGEPLLAGIEFFEYFVKRVEEHNYKDKVAYSLQTNGTLLTDEWAEFFAKNNFLIGISLDGNRDCNKFRVMADNTSSFDKIIGAIKILDIKKVDYNILSVVTGYLADNIKQTYEFFKGMGFKYLQFIPCLRPFGDNSQSELYMTEKQFENYLITLFELYAKDFLKGNYISIRSLDNMVRLYAGGMAEQCGMNGFCSRQFVVEGNGNIYPCDFYSNDEWLLGNINNTDFRAVFQLQLAIKFLKESCEIDGKCEKCKFLRLCRGGGCKREKQSVDYCVAYKNFYEKCTPLFESIMQKLREK